MTSKRLLAGAGVALLVAAGFTVGMSRSADAATCYGGEVAFKKDPLVKAVPASGWFRTSSRCRDINVRIRENPAGLKGRNVMVCFETAAARRPSPSPGSTRGP